jgi:putative spermidine/putrescine transport system permease protein
MPRPVWSILNLLIFLKKHLPKSFYGKAGYLLLLPGIVSVGFLAVGLMYVGSYSILTFDPYYMVVYKPTLNNYMLLLTTPAYLTIFFRTLKISFIASIASIILGFFYAYLTVRTRSSILQKVLLIALFVPFFTGDVIRVYGWLIILGKNGLISFVSRLAFGKSVDLIFTESAVAIGLTQVLLPLAVLMIAPAIVAIRRDLEYAAMNLGASEFRTLKHVVIPLSKPGLVAAFVTTFTIGVTAYAEADILGGGKADFAANAIFNFMFNASAYPQAAALSILVTFVASIVVFIVLKKVGLGTLMYSRTGG